MTDTLKRTVVLIFAVVAMISTVSFYMYVNTPEREEEKQNEAEDFVVKAFQDGDWKIPKNYTIYTDEKNIGRNPELLEEYEDGWYGFPGELRSIIGPWVYKVTLWYNKNTNQTHIQRM